MIMYFIISFILLYIWTRLRTNLNYIVHRFKLGNVIVFGAKGKGKDLLFQNVIRIGYSKKRQKRYSANMPYGYNFDKSITFSDIHLDPNTYEDFIDDNVEKVKPNFPLFHDIFMSDAGVMLASHFDKKLSEKYKSYPILYAFSRQLYEMNIHLNTQNLERIWKKAREQGDTYIKALRVVKIPFLIFQKVRVYDEYNTALEGRLPYKAPALFGKDYKVQKETHNAMYGHIDDMWLVIPKKKIKYDTYYFRKVLFSKEDIEDLEKDVKPLL